MPSALVEGYFDPHFRGNSVPKFFVIGFGAMPTIPLEPKGTSNMPGQLLDSVILRGPKGLKIKGF
jgi:hypothetical protein